MTLCENCWRHLPAVVGEQPRTCQAYYEFVKGAGFTPGTVLQWMGDAERCKTDLLPRNPSDMIELAVKLSAATKNQLHRAFRSAELDFSRAASREWLMRQLLYGLANGGPQAARVKQALLDCDLAKRWWFTRQDKAPPAGNTQGTGG